MSELTKKRVHWKEYNGEELVHDEDVDVLTSADAVTFDDGEDLQYKYTQGQFVNPSTTGSLSNLSTTNKSSLVDAINEVKTDATSNESSIDSLTDRATTSENDIDSLETRMTTVESDIDNVETRMSTAESDIDSLEGRMSTAESDIDSLESRITPIPLGGTGATTASGALTNLGITATASELNVLDGITATTTELNYVDGVTSAIQTQLNGKASKNHEHDTDDITSGTLPISRGGTGATTASEAVSNLKTALVDLLYPIGSIHMSVNSENPSTYFGGTWVSWSQGRVPVGVNTSDSNFSTVEKTGGEKTHKLTINEMPSHYHRTDGDGGRYGWGGNAKGWAWSGDEGGFATNLYDVNTGISGGNASHNNLQPYITCYMWKRTE